MKVPNSIKALDIQALAQDALKVSDERDVLSQWYFDRAKSVRQYFYFVAVSIIIYGGGGDGSGGDGSGGGGSGGSGGSGDLTIVNTNKTACQYASYAIE